MNLWDSIGVPSAVKRGNRAGRKARLFAVGAAGQDYRDAAAENEAGGLGLCDENELLGKHVAGLEIWHDQNVGMPRDQRGNPLRSRRSNIDRIVHCQWPIN